MTASSWCALIISNARLFAAKHTVRCDKAFTQGGAASAAHVVATTPVRGTTIQVFLIKNPLLVSSARLPLLHLSGLTDRGQFKESAEVLGSLNAHNEALQLLALVFADDIAAERSEFYRDFFLGHRIPRITLGHIHTS
jgi:hypothetical protein